MPNKVVVYDGESATHHRLAFLSPGKNVLDEGIADRLLAAGVVRLPYAPDDSNKMFSPESPSTGY